MSIALSSPTLHVERGIGRSIARALSSMALSTHGRPAVVRPMDCTHDTISAVARTGGVHGWVESLGLHGRTVDHVVLDGAGVTTIASTWPNGALTESALVALAADAAGDAIQTTTVVRAAGCDAAVRPVVAVWGDAQADVPAGGVTSSGALVIRGADLEAFLAWSASTHDAFGFNDAVDLLVGLEDVPSVERVVSTVR